MTHKELQRTLAALELSQLAAARLLGVGNRTMRHWILGDRAIPPPVSKLLLLMHIPLVRQRLEQMKG